MKRDKENFPSARHMSELYEDVEDMTFTPSVQSLIDQLADGRIGGVFDVWRSVYDEMTPESHRAVNRLMCERWPDQRHYHPASVSSFLTMAEPGTVMEFGGYTGQLASEMLAQFPAISRWVNCDFAPVDHVCLDSRYSNGEVEPSDALVAAHVFEHIREHEIDAVLRGAMARDLYIDCPLPARQGTNWRGYQGTHILSLSWSELAELIEGHGYTETARWDTVKSHARAYRVVQ